VSEMPGIEIPAVPPPGAQVRVQVADLQAGTITDLATGEVTPGPQARVCAYIQSYPCSCDDPAQCPVLRQHPAEAAAAWAAQQARPDTTTIQLPPAIAEAVAAQGFALQPDGSATWADEQTGLPLGPELARELVRQQVAEDPSVSAAPAPPGKPVLLHSGNYGLYQTPEGSFHLVYQRTAGTNPATGRVVAIDGAPDIHMRDLPERAANMVAAIMDRDTPLPPLLESIIFGGAKPNLRAVMAAVRQMGGLDDLIGGDDATE
jgi:hypothetical protein